MHAAISLPHAATTRRYAATARPHVATAHPHGHGSLTTHHHVLKYRQRGARLQLLTNVSTTPYGLSLTYCSIEVWFDRNALQFLQSLIKDVSTDLLHQSL